MSSSSAFAPMPPPRTTSPTSVTAAMGTMCSAMRRASSTTTARATGSPLRAEANTERASYGGVSVVRAPAASRSATAASAAAHGSRSCSSPTRT